MVGVWDDGALPAYCDDGIRDGLDDADTWFSHGPDPGDDWHAYTGSRMAVWLRHAALS
jgi:hypothetical protein